MEKGNNKIFLLFFTIVFFISNFNALLQIYVNRILLTAFYIVFLGIALIYYLIKKRFRIPVAGGTYWIMFYIIWLILRFSFQVISGETTSISVINFAQTLIPVFAFYISKELNNKEALLCEKRYVIFAIISCLLGYINHFIIEIIPEIYFNRELVRIEGVIHSRFYSMSGFSLGTGWMAGVAIAFLLCTKSEIVKHHIIKVIAFIVFGASVLLTFSRGGLFFTLINLLIQVLLSLNTNPKSFKSNIILIWSVVFFLCSIAFFVSDNIISSNAFFQRYLINAFDSKTSLRASFWRQAINLIKQYPFCGKGYGFVGSVAYTRGIGEKFPPENYFFQIMINTGMVGLILFLLSTIVLILSKLTMCRCKLNTHIVKYFGVVIGALAWCLMSTPLEGDINTFVFWYSIGRIMCENFLE